MTTLGFYATWRDADTGGKKEKHFFYHSQVLDHSALFAEAAMADALERLHASSFKELRVWADCGPHFRCYSFAHFVLVACLRKHGMQASVLNFFAEKHGKGRNDGSFGLMERWLINGCRRCVRLLYRLMRRVVRENREKVSNTY